MKGVTPSPAVPENFNTEAAQVSIVRSSHENRRKPSSET